jgi:F-type H+-transporting ATPase subunit b
MQIDWLTVAAQIVNFLILVWLLQRYLYRPIIKAMDDREQRIAARLREAAEQKAAADREAQSYRSQRDALERDKESILSKTREEAGDVKRSLEDAARREVDERRLDWLRQLEDERRAFLQEMRRRSADHVLTLARRALKELADARLEEQIAAVFAKRLDDLEPHLQKKIAKACQDAGGTVTVRTRFELPADEQRRITRTIHKQISEMANVGYERSEEAISGIQLIVGRQTVAWTLDSFLDDLERHLSKELADVIPHAEEARKP